MKDDVEMIGIIKNYWFKGGNKKAVYRPWVLEKWLSELKHVHSVSMLNSVSHLGVSI